MKNPKTKARDLVRNLEKKAKANPDQFRENYGQKEVRKFGDKLDRENPELSYRERAEISNILKRVYEITPY